MVKNLEAVPPRAQVAVLIDGDHIPPKVVGQVIAKAETVGNPTIRRVYANWSGIPKNWREILSHYHVTHMHYESPPRGTNATDITLVVDALKLFYRDGIRHFCLVASDSDYTALVWELRREGCVILGIGQTLTTPPTLQQACTSFVLANQLSPAAQLPSNSTSSSKKAATSSKKTKQPKQKSEPASPREKLPALLVNVCHQVIHMTKSEWITLSTLGQALKQHDPKFKTRSYGYKSLTKLVAAQTALLEMRHQEGNIQVRLRGTS